MTGFINLSQMDPEEWINTSLARSDGKIEYRQRPKYGNLHALFEKNSEWGEIHNDEHNALDFPNGTVDHLAKYTNEKTSIPEDWASAGIVVGGLVVGAALLKYIEEKI